MRKPIDVNVFAESLKISARLAGLLFIAATASTMAGQIIIEPLVETGSRVTESNQNTLALAVVFEVMNGLSSAGIAIVVYPLLQHIAQTVAIGYLGLRLIEGTLGIAAAAGLLMMMGGNGEGFAHALALHDALFLLVLVVFSVGTLLFYPVLFTFRLVPRLLSVWGLVGGMLLLVSCVLILFGRIEIGGSVDLILSLPIWINEMVLAVWLLTRGFNLSAIAQSAHNA